ncbi:hypothetical protein VTN00DRAFT_4272 [Thermoascus crustaceus]|uniref:uncharacterized protein n=1 Tax=Thermoascus crustaceus TaxID=5088 RepID=UPI003743A489
MAHWREEYFAALGVRDEREKANVALYDAYTRLADRTGRLALAATNTPHLSVTSPEQSQQPPPPAGTASPKKKVPSPSRQQPQQELPTADALAAARADLATAQRSRAELEDRLSRTTAELEKLKKKSTQDGRRVAALESERTHLQMRLKDRDEELRGKAKLLNSVQDELASLNLQLNMAEDRSSRLQRENQELVDRWMARMGKEADAMNEASKF